MICQPALIGSVVMRFGCSDNTTVVACQFGLQSSNGASELANDVRDADKCSAKFDFNRFQGDLTLAVCS